MRFSAGIVAFAAALFTVTACSDVTDPDEDIPHVERVSAASAPAPPAGTHVACYTNQAATTPDTECSIIRWRENTYWVFSYDDLRPAFNVSVYNQQGIRIFQSEHVGARNLWQISVDPDAENVTLSGEGGQTVVLPWTSLAIPED